MLTILTRFSKENKINTPTFMGSLKTIFTRTLQIQIIIYLHTIYY